MSLGWYVTYIDRDPETLAAQERKAKKQKMDKDDEERMMEFIEKQVEKGQQETSGQSETTKEPLTRVDNDTPLVINMKINKKPKLLPIIKQEADKASTGESVSMILNIKSEKLNDDEYTDKERSSIKSEKHIPKRSEDDDSSEGWLRVGLIVKVVTKTLGNKYYKSKGVIQSVENSSFVGKVKLKSPEEVENHIIKLDQEYLETVIPAIGKQVVILWGKYKGMKGMVHKLHVESYSIDVKLEWNGTIVKDLPYEQICKYET